MAVTFQHRCKRVSGKLGTDTTRRFRFVVAFLVAALLLPVALAENPSSTGSRPEKRKTSARDRSQSEVQALVMEIADEYIATLGEATYLIDEKARSDSRTRWLIQSFLRNGVGAAIDIGTGPNPNVAILDLLVLSSLQAWAFEKNWTKAGIDPSVTATPLKRLKEGEQLVWERAARVLDKQQLDTMQQLVGAWISSNPDRVVVSLVRFSEFTDERHLPAAGAREKARSLLINLDQVTQSVDQARLLGERLIWFAGRYPYVLGEQSELTVYRIADQPEFKKAMAALESLQTVSTAMNERLDNLPRDMDAQRNAIFKQLGDERAATVNDAKTAMAEVLQGAIHTASTQLDQQTTNLLEKIDARQESLTTTMRELHATVEASTTLSHELTGTAQAVDQILTRFQEIPDSNREPIRIPDIREAAVETAEAARDLTVLLERTNEILTTDAWDRRLGQFDAYTTQWADKLFWRGLLLVTLLITGLGLLRLVPPRPK